MLKRILLSTGALLALLFANACSSVSVISTLNAVVASAEAAVPVLAASGAIPPGSAILIDDYLNQVSVASSEAASELASKDTPEEKALIVTADFSSIALPDMTGLPAQVTGYVSAVQAALKAFLESIAVASTEVSKAKGRKIQFGVVDRVRLDRIGSRADKLSLQLLKMEGAERAQGPISRSLPVVFRNRDVRTNDLVYRGEPITFSDGVYHGEPIQIVPVSR